MKSQSAASAPSGTVAAARVEVSALDGPMPETRDHFNRIRSSGGRSVEVALVNCQVANDSELIELVDYEIRSLASECGLAVTAIIRT